MTDERIELDDLELREDQGEDVKGGIFKKVEIHGTATYGDGDVDGADFLIWQRHVGQ